jgi:hypothetical protein
VIRRGKNKAAIPTAARITPRTYACANLGKDDISSPPGGKNQQDSVTWLLVPVDRSGGGSDDAGKDHQDIDKP